MGVSGAIAIWISVGEVTISWDTTSRSNQIEGKPFGRADKALMLALLALEAMAHAVQYEGLSTIYVSARELANRLDNRRVRWGKMKDPASRVLRKVFKIAAAMVQYKHHEAVNRVVRMQ